MHGSRKEFLSISLGFEDDPKETRQKQSIKRAWNRLSSLQRSVICLVLLLGFLSIVYLVPAIRHPEHAPDEEILNAKAASARGRLDPPIVVNEAMKRGNKPAHHIPQKLPEDNQRHDLERIAKKQVDDIVRKMKRPVRVVQPVNEKQALNELPRPQGGGEEAGLLPPDEKGEHLERDENGDVNGKEDDNDKDDSVDGQLNPAEKPANPDSDFNEDAKGISTFNYFDPNRKYTERQLAVVDAFKHAWTGYKCYAWGHDEYHPISRTHSEWFGVGLTIVDSIDTIVLMGLKEQYDEAREWVVKDLTFKKDRDVNLFEITIRVLGGLLASYHLTGEEVFKEKAIDLGDRLLPCFNSKSKVPFSDVNLLTGRAHPPKWGPDSSTSEVTTIQLELRDLSRVTKDPKYEKAIEEVSMHVHELPKKDGLVPIFINANTGQFRSTSTITFGARGDSYYEYLLKQWIQTGKTKNVYKEDYIQAMEGMKTHLMRESEPNKLLYIGELLGSRSFSPKMDHLVCFLPGTMALGYKNGLPTDHFDIAKKMVKTCFQMYVKTPTKLSPEIVYFNQARESKDDIIIKPADAHNLMRPETVESLFYMYRFTGDTMYQDWGWTIFQAFLKHSKVADGFTSLHNVKSATNPGYADKLESFFLSETLKYLFLLFDDESSLVPLDKYVFNSEGHPLPIYSS